ncbi:carbamoyltransferase C-terminal domain-containing protein [Streptomyces sp. NPDC057253]|uniref:carbamoyltransferase C-terminal domain-containing protein n=1 Tax=Streptomyces sp. NPDC057253 TaxID=3346069 RepID=UPI0036314962
MGRSLAGSRAAVSSGPVRWAARILADPRTRDSSPAYGALIAHIYQLTGVPVVLNTSYNDREPIVEIPARPRHVPGLRPGYLPLIGSSLIRWIRLGKAAHDRVSSF